MDSQLATLRKQRAKIQFSIVLSCVFLLLLGSTLTLLALDNFFLISIGTLSFERLIFLSAFCLFGLILSQLYRLQKRLYQGAEFLNPGTFYDQKSEIHLLKSETDRFHKEYKMVLKSQLRVSILFWTHYYKKEKMMSYQDAKREIFKNMRKEFSHVHWMADLMSEIRREIDDFDRSKTRVEE